MSPTLILYHKDHSSLFLTVTSHSNGEDLMATIHHLYLSISSILVWWFHHPVAFHIPCFRLFPPALDPFTLLVAGA